MSGVYDDKPSEISQPNQWHEISFQISVDTPVDWDKVDLRKWSHAVARFTALRMAESAMSEDERISAEIVRTILLNVKVQAIEKVSDADLHNLIDEFDETGD